MIIVWAISGSVSSVVITDNVVNGVMRDNSKFEVTIPQGADVISRLLFGTVNSLVEWYRPGGPVDADTLARSVTTLAFDGLSRPAG